MEKSDFFHLIYNFIKGIKRNKGNLGIMKGLRKYIVTQIMEYLFIMNP